MMAVVDIKENVGKLEQTEEWTKQAHNQIQDYKIKPDVENEDLYTVATSLAGLRGYHYLKSRLRKSN